VGTGKDDEREDPLPEQRRRDVRYPEIVAAQADPDRARPKLMLQLVALEECSGVFEELIGDHGGALAHRMLRSCCTGRSGISKLYVHGDRAPQPGRIEKRDTPWL
jgi:hypothetical protein